MGTARRRRGRPPPPPQPTQKHQGAFQKRLPGPGTADLVFNTVSSASFPEPSVAGSPAWLLAVVGGHRVPCLPEPVMLAPRQLQRPAGQPPFQGLILPLCAVSAVSIKGKDCNSPKADVLTSRKPGGPPLCVPLFSSPTASRPSHTLLLTLPSAGLLPSPPESFSGSQKGILFPSAPVS